LFHQWNNQTVILSICSKAERANYALCCAAMMNSFQILIETPRTSLLTFPHTTNTSQSPSIQRNISLHFNISLPKLPALPNEFQRFLFAEVMLSSNVQKPLCLSQSSARKGRHYLWHMWEATTFRICTLLVALLLGVPGICARRHNTSMVYRRI
jgi:hypothetical protein